MKIALFWALMILIGAVALCVLVCAAKLILILVEDIQDSMEYRRRRHE